MFQMFLVLFLIVLPVYSLDNGVGLTPALGWSTWNTFQGSVSDSLLRESADAMVSSGLLAAGYEYINLDDGWAIGRDGQGNIIVDPKLFPNGLKPVSDYIHSKGLKFGMYTARGSTTCMGRPGADGHEEQDAAFYASIGTDYLKEDSCGGHTNGTMWEQYERMKVALNRTGRPIYFSITQAESWNDGHPHMHCYGDGAFSTLFWTTASPPLDPRTLANSYLIEYCNNEDFFGFTDGRPQPGGFLSNLDSQQLLTWDNMTGPGSWNDNDMLEVCHGSQSYAEYAAQFSTWSILASPLILGNDIRSISPECLAIITNREVIAVNQDVLGLRGKLVLQWPQATWPSVDPALSLLKKAAHPGHRSQKGRQEKRRRKNKMNAPQQQYNNNNNHHHHTGKEKSGGTFGGGPGPAPLPLGSLALALCNASDPSQLFTWSPTDGLIRHVADASLCLTYGGYHEANFYSGDCTGWTSPGIGSQQWLPQPGNGSLQCVDNFEKVIDVLDCAVNTTTKGGGSSVQVCTAGGDDCYSNPAGGGPSGCGLLGQAWKFDFSTAGSGTGATTPTTIASAVPVDGKPYSYCMTSRPLPPPAVDIQLQVWVKPLVDGGVAFVAFNRSPRPLTANVTWELLGWNPSVRASLRDLWAHADLGNFTGVFSSPVQPHSVVMIRATPEAQS